MVCETLYESFFILAVKRVKFLGFVCDLSFFVLKSLTSSKAGNKKELKEIISGSFQDINNNSNACVVTKINESTFKGILKSFLQFRKKDERLSC